MQFRTPPSAENRSPLQSDSEGKLHLGKYMTITRAQLRSGFLTPEQRNKLGLQPESIVGIVDIARNLPTLGKDENWIAFARSLHTSTLGSLHVLADACQNNHPLLKDVKAFVGISHLARAADKYGFAVYDVNSWLIRFLARYVGKQMAKAVAGKSKGYAGFQKTFKDPQLAIILRDDLVRRYATNPPQS